MLSFAKLRCVIRERFAGLLLSWIRRILGLSDSFMMVHQMLLSHYCDVVLPVKVLLVSVEVDQFPVERLIEVLEVLQTFLEFPEPILSSARVFQHILDFVVA